MAKSSSMRQDTNGPSRANKHRHTPSATSGIAASAISFDTVVSLSAFPSPPTSLPSTPRQSEFSHGPPSASDQHSVVSQPSRLAPSVSRSREPTSPLAGPSRSAIPSVPNTPSPLDSRSQISATSQRSDPRRAKTSPFHWHDGASSIGSEVDQPGDDKLPTSFITDLLRKELTWVDPYPSKDNASGISELSYPPPSHPSPPIASTSSYYQAPRPVQRPNGSRPPPSSYVPVILQRNLSSLGSEIDSGPTPSTSSDGRMSNSGHIPDSASAEYQLLRHAQVPSGITSPSPEPSPSMSGSQVPFLPNRTDSRAPPVARAAYAPSFVSKMSSKSRSIRSVQRALQWLRKPLPPVPVLPHIPIAEQDRHKKEDEALSFPELAGRSQALQNLLAQGHRPHRSLDSYAVVNHEDAQKSFQDTHSRTAPSQGTSSRRRARTQILGRWSNTPRGRIIKLMLAVALILVVIIVVVVAVVVTSSRHKSATSTCPETNRTGAVCDLDSTCVCTSSTPGRCDELSQSVIDLLPTLNNLFDTNFTSNSMSAALEQTLGAPAGSCAQQAQLIDVAPALSRSSFPNRTAWAQSALLWNAVMTQDSGLAKDLQSFVKGKDWGELGSTDGPDTSSPSGWSTPSGGYTFDFAAQKASPPSGSFLKDGQPRQEQINLVNPDATSVLDRLYGYAKGSSQQQETALLQYWRGTLKQDQTTLRDFISAFSAADILVPFDAMWSMGQSTISGQLNGSSSKTFPFPLACYPGLSNSQRDLISSTESSMFGMSSLSAPSSFDSSCYANRPVYGVLDVTRLRWPFTDDKTGVPQQGVVLASEVSPRAILFIGDKLAPLPTSPANGSLTPSDVNPRQAGTMKYLQHIVLQYLSSMPVAVAQDVATYLLTSEALPPTAESSPSLFNYLPSLPTIQVAVFGSMSPSCMEYAVSSFSKPSGGLFFGTDQSQTFRNWAIGSMGSTIRWTESAVAPKYVSDKRVTGVLEFDTTFQAAYNFTHSPNPGVVVTVQNITSSFNSTGQYTDGG